MLRDHVARGACQPVQTMARALMTAEIGRIRAVDTKVERAVVWRGGNNYTPLLADFFPRAAATIRSATCDCPQCAAVRGDAR